MTHSEALGVNEKYVYATRKSALALAQCRAFVRTLEAAAEPGTAFVEEQVVTSGDRIQDRPLSEVGGKGLFVKEIEEALFAKKADFAVHSIKDVPGFLPGGLVLACIPKRADPRDVLVAPRHGRLRDLPGGATVGTSSLRRAVALRRVRPDLSVIPLRGNVDTRLRKVDAGDCDAIVLARAGLVRLGLEARATEDLEPEVSLPAVGQGALGIETREEDDRIRSLLARVEDHESLVCVAAERGVMKALEGDCKTPLAAYAEVRGTLLVLRAFVAEPDGSRYREGTRSVGFPASALECERLGMDLGDELKRR